MVFFVVSETKGGFCQNMEVSSVYCGRIAQRWFWESCRESHYVVN